MKKIYNYDPQTGLYVGEGLADENPRNPKAPLIPDYATTQKPPRAKAGFYVVYKDGAWAQIEKPKAEKPAAPEPPTADELAAMARGKRNKLLSASDWVMLPDVPSAIVNRLEGWKLYRQALRDVPQQMNFPNSIVWPDQPK